MSHTLISDDPATPNVDESGGLDSPSFMVLGRDDKLYISNVDQVLRFNATTGTFIDVFVGDNPATAEVDESGGLRASSGLVFGADGNLYVSNALPENCNVLRYQGPSGDSPGQFIDVFAGHGSSTKIVDQGGALVAPTGLAFHDGRLFVGTALQSDSVLRYDQSTGAFVDAFVSDDEATPNRDESGGLDNPHSLLFTDDGHLLVSSRWTNRVLGYDANTGDFIRAIGSPQRHGLSHPKYLVFGPAGGMYVLSWSLSTCMQFDTATGTLINEFPVDGLFENRTSVAFGPDGHLYIASYSKNQVVRYDRTSGDLAPFVAAGSGGLNGPMSMVFGSDGRLYVTSHMSNEVLRYDGKTGEFIDVFVKPAEGKLVRPADLAFGPDGRLYVASPGSRQIIRYDGSTGAFVDVFVGDGFSSFGEDRNELKEPWLLTFGPDGNLYIADTGRNEVIRYSGRNGAFIDVFVDRTSGLDEPSGLGFGRDGNLYVASARNSRILRYQGPLKETPRMLIDVFVSPRDQRSTSINALFLAMSHWQLGHTRAAHVWYARAIEGTDDFTSTELIRFGAQTARLLEMQNKSGS